MKIEKGKKYVLENAGIVECVEIGRDGAWCKIIKMDSFLLNCAGLIIGQGSMFGFDGKRANGGNCLDIVSEYTEKKRKPFNYIGKVGGLYNIGWANVVVKYLGRGRGQVVQSLPGSGFQIGSIFKCLKKEDMQDPCKGKKVTSPINHTTQGCNSEIVDSVEVDYPSGTTKKPISNLKDAEKLEAWKQDPQMLTITVNEVPFKIDVCDLEKLSSGEYEVFPKAFDCEGKTIEEVYDKAKLVVRRGRFSGAMKTTEVFGVDLYTDYTTYSPEIKQVIHQGNNTVVILKSGKKGIARLQEGDIYNRELGFWVAYAKALRGSPKWLDKIHMEEPTRKLVSGLKEAYVESVTSMPTSGIEFLRHRVTILSKV